MSQKFLEKKYNANELLKYSEAKNPKFYPSPVKGRGEKGDDGKFQPESITEGFLTQEGFCTLYNRSCGKILHAQRETKFEVKHDQFIEEAAKYRDRMVKLLNFHWIHLTDRNANVVIMNESKTGEVAISEADRVEEDVPTRP